MAGWTHLALLRYHQRSPKSSHRPCCIDVATVVSVPVVLLFKVCFFITLRYCPCKTLSNNAQYCRKRMYRIEYCQVCSAVLQVVTSCLICGIWGRSHSLHTHAPCPALCAAYFIKYLMNICTASLSDNF